MNDKKTPKKECKNSFCPAMVNPFDAMMMVVVRRFDRALRELENRKAPLNEVELLHQNAKISFYNAMVMQSIETKFSPEEIVALYQNEELAEGAWLIWNDIKCPLNKLLIIIAKLSVDDEVKEAVVDFIM